MIEEIFISDLADLLPNGSHTYTIIKTMNSYFHLFSYRQRYRVKHFKLGEGVEELPILLSRLETMPSRSSTSCN
jgi:hypothetical protein